jgi:hypothetical protein
MTEMGKLILSADRRKMTCDHLAQWLAPPVFSALIASYDFGPLSEYLANRTAATLAAQAPIVNAKKEDKGTKRKAVAGSRGVEVSYLPREPVLRVKLTASGAEEGQHCFDEQVDEFLQAKGR